MEKTDLIIQGLNVHTEKGVLANSAVICSGSIIAKIDDRNRSSRDLIAGSNINDLRIDSAVKPRNDVLSSLRNDVSSSPRNDVSSSPRNDVLSSLRNDVSSSRKNIVGSGTLEFPSSWHLVPGFIDLHIHGTNGADTMDATLPALETMSIALAKEGVTGFLATTVTSTPKIIEHTLKNVATYVKQQEDILGAELLGVHLEGPFLSKGHPGAHKLDLLLAPDLALFKTWQQAANDNIRIVALAPELPNGIEFIKYLKQHKIVASIGHTMASYEEANEAIAAGASECTHLFNCMPQLHHRTPGALLALLLNDNIMGEIIADGFHLHPDIVKLAYKLKGFAHNVLITDSMRAKNLADGIYDLGGQQVTVTENKARLASGAIAGSTLHIDKAIRNMMRFTGCSFTEALQMATINPAKQINIFDRKGSIAPGKDADLVVLDDNYHVQMTIARGRVVFRRGESSYSP